MNSTILLFSCCCCYSLLFHHFKSKSLLIFPCALLSFVASLLIFPCALIFCCFSMFKQINVVFRALLIKAIRRYLIIILLGKVQFLA